MLEVEVYWSVRSPYSYLVTPRLYGLARDYDVSVQVRPVYPHAVRDVALTRSRGPLWLAYFRTDIVRTAAHLGLPIAWPRPDPVTTDPATGEAHAEQPLLRHITHTVEAAERAGRGIAYIRALVAALWDPQAPEWTTPGVLDAVARAAGLDPVALDREVATNGGDLEAAIQRHDQAQAAAGHWGVPLMVFRGEPFFGQDRFDQLLWRLRQAGLTPRSTPRGP